MVIEVVGMCCGSVFGDFEAVVSGCPCREQTGRCDRLKLMLFSSGYIVEYAFLVGMVLWVREG